MPNVKVGDEVRVFDINGRRMGQPDGGWPGTVVKVGRKLVTVQYGYATKVFRLEDGTTNDQYCHQSFMTLDEAARAERLTRATDVIEARGIELVRGHRLSLEQIEALADFVRKL